MDKCIGSRIHIIMKHDKEIVGTLLGFDDFVNMLLGEYINWILPLIFELLLNIYIYLGLFTEDVTEYENTSEGRRVTKLDQILLNGNNITMVM